MRPTNANLRGERRPDSSGRIELYEIASECWFDAGQSLLVRSRPQRRSRYFFGQASRTGGEISGCIGVGHLALRFCVEGL
jgi:hypothetical protein